MTRRILFCLACLLAVACNREPAAQLTTRDEAPAVQIPAGSVPGHIRVRFKHEPARTKAGGLDLTALGEYTMSRTFPPAGKWEARHREAGLHLWYDIVFDPSLPLTKAAGAVGALEDVDVVEFIAEARTQALDYPFNDPRLPYVYAVKL